MRGLSLDTVLAFILAFVIQVYSSAIRSEGLPVIELRQRNHCFGGNSSKMSNSYLWRAIRDPPVYFFGTIHVPYPKVWNYIPENAKQAFRESENAFFELDLTDSNTSRNLKKCQMLPRGENLSTVLPENMYQRLKNHLGYVQNMMRSWGVYDEELFHAIAGNWERKRPIWVMLMVNTLNEADIKSRGIPVLDLHLTNEAVKMDKQVGAIEVVQEQCVPLNGLNVSQVLFLLNRTLWQQEALREGTIENSYNTEDLIWHYNCGDLNSMIFNLDTAQIPNIFNSTMSEADIRLAEEIGNYFVEELINKRNHQMASRVKEIIESNSKSSFFFALGAGHFLGNNSVLDLLEAEGLEIENIPADVDLNSLKDLPRSSDTSSGQDKRRGDNDRAGKGQKPPTNVHFQESKFKELWQPLDSISDKNHLFETTTADRGIYSSTSQQRGSFFHVFVTFAASFILTGMQST